MSKDLEEEGQAMRLSEEESARQRTAGPGAGVHMAQEERPV